VPVGRSLGLGDHVQRGLGPVGVDVVVRFVEIRARAQGRREGGFEGAFAGGYVDDVAGWVERLSDRGMGWVCRWGGGGHGGGRRAH
jgi:hypothetical protein